uniref:Uncharacterized protein n=1 Tax=Rhizophora mucronata TaxID=61149 RepID=A0A2P2P333_RHIMU
MGISIPFHRLVTFFIVCGVLIFCTDAKFLCSFL